MANISEYLRHILSARYGRDVRQSIHDSIDAINKEVAADKDEVVESKNEAAESATHAQESAERVLNMANLSQSYAVGCTGTRDGEDTDNAKYYSEQAKESAKKAEEVAGIGYAETGTKAGLVKPMDIHVDSTDGAMRMTATTTDTTLTNSYAGGLKINEIGGVSEQNGEPTPEAPVDIESVVVGEIKVTGAQLYDITNYPLTDGMWINSTNGLQSTSSVYASTPYIPCTHLQGMTLTLNKRPGGALPGIAFYLEQKKDAFISGVANANETAGQPITFTVPVDAVYMQFTVPSGATEIMLNEGTEALPYEPYTEKIITLSNPITLNGIGEVQDRIVKQNGVFGVERKFAEVVFDGSEDEEWAISTTNTSGIKRVYTSVIKRTVKRASADNSTVYLLCTVATSTSSAKTYRCEKGIAIGTAGELFVYDSAYNTSDITLWTSYLAENPVAVLYPLAETTFEPLPEADQIALHSLVTFDTVTYISTDSAVEPTWDVEYGTSKVGALALENANLHELVKVSIGDTDISNIADGTLTGAVSKANSDIKYIVNSIGTYINPASVSDLRTIGRGVYLFNGWATYTNHKPFDNAWGIWIKTGDESAGIYEIVIHLDSGEIYKSHNYGDFTVL